MCSTATTHVYCPQSACVPSSRWRNFSESPLICFFKLPVDKPQKYRDCNDFLSLQPSFASWCKVVVKNQLSWSSLRAQAETVTYWPCNAVFERLSIKNCWHSTFIVRKVVAFHGHPEVFVCVSIKSFYDIIMIAKPVTGLGPPRVQVKI